MKKHKILLPLYLSMITCQVLTAQVSLGLRVGLFSQNLHFDPLAEGSAKPRPIPGFQAALPVEIGLSAHWSIQLEPMYGQHGYVEMTSQELMENGYLVKGEITSKTRISSFEIPILTKWKFGPKRHFYLVAGPSVDFGLDGNLNSDGNIYVTGPMGESSLIPIHKTYSARFLNNNYDPSELDTEKAFSVAKTSLNLHLGAGLNLKMSFGSIFLEGRYITTLSDLNPEANGTPDADRLVVKSNRLGLCFGFLLRMRQ